MQNHLEYIKCIRHTHEERKNTSWCGKAVYTFDWTFVDIDHATYSIMNGSRNVPCPDCIKVINQILLESCE